MWVEHNGLAYFYLRSFYYLPSFITMEPLFGGRFFNSRYFPNFPHLRFVSLIAVSPGFPLGFLRICGNLGFFSAARGGDGVRRGLLLRRRRPSATAANSSSLPAARTASVAPGPLPRLRRGLSNSLLRRALFLPAFSPRPQRRRSSRRRCSSSPGR